MQTPIGASRATSIELSVNDELVFIVYRIGLMRFTRTRVTYNGTAVVVGFVTSAANRPVICPVRPGNCPGSKLVWRNICKVGCGWLRYRVTMMQGFGWLNS